MISPQTTQKLAIAIVVAATVIAFCPVLGNGFVSWGDQADIVNNPNYRGLAPDNLVWMFTTIQTGHYQPLSWVSLAVDHAVWGMDPRGYHLTSLLLHAACAVAVFFLIMQLLRIAMEPLGEVTQRVLPWVALAGTLLFAVHPLRVETVAWATERRGSLSALFLVLSILLYLRSARGRPAPESLGAWFGAAGAAYWWSVAFFGMSLLSKEFGITLPAILLVLDAYPLRRIRPGPLARQLAALVLEKLPYLVLAIAGAAVALASSVQSGVAKSVAEYSLMQRLAQSFHGLAFYNWKSILPIDLSPLYAIPRDFNPFAPVYVLSAIAVVGLTIALFVLRKRVPALLAAWACFVIVLSPVLGLVQTGRQMAADRYTYLPAIAVSALVSALILRLIAHGSATATRRVVVLLITGVITIGLAICTWRYSMKWRDSLSLWQQAVSVEPDNVHVLNNLGVALIEAGRIAEAAQNLQRALSLDENLTDAHNNLGAILASQGRIDEAVVHWQKVLEQSPNDADALANLKRARELQSGR